MNLLKRLTMNVIQWKTNTKIGIAVFFGVLFALYFFIPRKSYKPKYVMRSKIRHPVSHYLRQITTNETLYKLATDHKFVHPDSRSAFQRYLQARTKPAEHLQVSYNPEPENFNIDNDVLVYIQIQKVGDTIFNDYLINNLDKGFDCGCTKNVLTNPCHCKNKNGHIWLFSWFTVGWPCELHADWTMMHDCVDKQLNMIEGKRDRRYFYITLLRDPITRYLSEWRHQRMGNHWEEAKLYCAGKRVELFDVRPCFRTETWFGVTLDEFMDCRENLATNRQTRMIADLTKSDCYHRNTIKPEKRAILQMDSAFVNLQKMAFFGLVEKPLETQHLFEKTFGLKFKSDFVTLYEESEEEMVSDDEIINIMKYIELDVQLYLFATDLFDHRLKKL